MRSGRKDGEEEGGGNEGSDGTKSPCFFFFLIGRPARILSQIVNAI